VKLTQTELQVLKLLLETVKKQHYEDTREHVDLASIAIRDRAYFLREFYAQELEKGDMHEEDFAQPQCLYAVDVAEFFLDKIEEAIEDDYPECLLPIIEHSSNSY
jgi:hypothetical protein